MEDHLRFAVCYWHSFNWDGFDVFGAGTLDRPWHPSFAPAADPIEAAKQKMDAAFEFFVKLGVPFYCFHDRDIAPEGASFKESAALFDEMVDVAAEHQQRTGVELLWGTANLFANPRYQAGAATNPDPEVFAYAAAQVAHCLEATHRLGGHNYVLWGGREGYETLLNTDMERELDQLARFLTMVVEHKQRIGFGGTILLEPKPCEPTKHQYDYDVATVYAFLQRYDLADEIKVNIEVNHASLSGHDFAHEVATAVNAGHLRVDRRQRRRRPARVGPRPLPGVGRTDDPRDGRDLARRRVRPRAGSTSTPSCAGSRSTAPTCSTVTSAGWTRWPGRCSPPMRCSASSTPIAPPATPAGTASSAARSSTDRPTWPTLHDRALDLGEPTRVSGGQERLENLVARHIARVR